VKPGMLHCIVTLFFILILFVSFHNCSFSDIAFMVPGTLAGRSEPELILSSTNSHVVRAFNPRTSM
jgi:hypothetical protein